MAKKQQAAKPQLSGSKFYTPLCIVRIIVEILQSHHFSYNQLGDTTIRKVAEDTPFAE